MPGKTTNGAGKRQLRLREDVIADRRAQVAQLRVEGLGSYAIASRTGWSRKTIDADLQWLRKQWQTEASLDYDSIMAAELQQLYQLRAQAWQSFRTSANPLCPEGDARFLAVILQTSTRVHDLLRLDDPTLFAARRVRSEGTDGRAEVLEVIVDDRGELADITDEDGTIRLAKLKDRVSPDRQAGIVDGEYSEK